MKKYLGDQSSRRVLLLCLLVYVFSAKGNIEVTDTAYSLETAIAIVDHSQLNIPYQAGYTTKGTGDRSYSKYGLGLALYYVPWVIASDIVSRATGVAVDGVRSFLISFASIPFGLFGLVLFAKLLELFAVTRVYVWFFQVVLGLGTLAWSYADSDFSEEIQMCLLLLAMYGILLGTSKGVAVGGLGFAILFLVKQVWLAFLPLFLCYLLLRNGDMLLRIKKIATFLLPFLFVGCTLAWLNLIRFGNPLEFGYGSEAVEFFPQQMWHTIPYILASLNKGLLIYCPILILSVVAWREFASSYRPQAILCAALLVENLLITASWHSWEGGWSWGSRFLVPLIPLWLLPIALWFNRRRSWPAFSILAIFTTISIVAQFPGILVKHNEIHILQQEISAATRQENKVPSDFVTAWILLWHKLSWRSEQYRLSDFNIAGDGQFDLTTHRTFLGFNVWTEQVSRQMNSSAARWLMVLAAPLLAFLAMKLSLTLKRALDDHFLSPPSAESCRTDV